MRSRSSGGCSRRRAGSARVRHRAPTGASRRRSAATAGWRPRGPAGPRGRDRGRLRQGPAGGAADGEHDGDARGPPGRRPGAGGHLRRALAPAGAAPGPERFVSFACMTIDAGTLAYANAGHPSRSARRAASSGASRAPAPCSASSPARRTRSARQWSRGDRLVLFTDGVLEAPAAGRGRARRGAPPRPPARAGRGNRRGCGRGRPVACPDLRGRDARGRRATVVVVDRLGEITEPGPRPE